MASLLEVDPHADPPAHGAINEQQMVDDLVACFPIEATENVRLVKFMSLIMLKYREYDMESAKERLTNYLIWRKELFGDLSDHSLESDKMIGEMLETCFLQTIMPPTGAGPVILYGQAKRHNKNKYTPMHVVKVWHYMIMCALQRDNEIAGHGFIVISNLTEVGYNNMDRGIGQILRPATKNVMPMRIKFAVLFNPSFLVHSAVSLMVLFLSTKMQGRIKSFSDETLFKTDLKIDPAVLPKQIGGQYDVYIPENHLKLYQDLGLSV
jgi:hypothetical protein